MKEGFGVGIWRYVANTFRKSSKGWLDPVQVSGSIFADSEEDVIKKLKDSGVLYPTGYEFLELRQE